VSDLDYSRHVFHSVELQDIVEKAIRFFIQTPVQSLPPPASFTGAGVYGLYYAGGFDLYAPLGNPACTHPVYIGKAVPPGWRTARAPETKTPDLYRRLCEHARSIDLTASLILDDLRCRFMILDQTDLIVPIEARLIRSYKPLWNTIMDGFGNHDPGSGRYNQARSEWDVLHPGRPWAERLTGESPRLEDIVTRIQQFLRSSGLS
jgi:hypothetical protein